jgi:hypothetical protein
MGGQPTRQRRRFLDRDRSVKTLRTRGARGVEPRTDIVDYFCNGFGVLQRHEVSPADTGDRLHRVSEIDADPRSLGRRVASPARLCDAQRIHVFEPPIGQ